MAKPKIEPSMMPDRVHEQARFHEIARDAGVQVNRYMLTYASGAIGVLFVSLAGNHAVPYMLSQKIAIAAALTFFSLTVAMCLLELHIDARRFFLTAKQLAFDFENQDWQHINTLKEVRQKTRYLSYITLILGTLCSALFLIIALFAHA